MGMSAEAAEDLIERMSIDIHTLEREVSKLMVERDDAQRVAQAERDRVRRLENELENTKSALLAAAILNGGNR